MSQQVSRGETLLLKQPPYHIFCANKSSKPTKKFYYKKKDCKSVAPVEFSKEPCIAFTLTNTFRRPPQLSEKSQFRRSSSEMLAHLRTITFCHVSRELPRRIELRKQGRKQSKALFSCCEKFKKFRWIFA